MARKKLPSLDADQDQKLASVSSVKFSKFYRQPQQAGNRKGREMKTYNANAQKDGKHWFIKVKELRGALGQARSLSEVDDVAREIARNPVKGLRAEGWAQKEAARVLGVSPQRIHQFEKL